MTEYIERTEELMLAMNAGARAIENTKHYHGVVYTKDVFSENPKEIPYLQAAKVLREVSDAPAVDVAPVVRCKDCKYRIYKHVNSWIGEIGGCSIFNHPMPNNAFCSFGERKDGGNSDEAD